jgi:hypothetical protein
VLDARDAALAAIQADLAGWYARAPFADAVHRLAAYRGITRLGALTLASEVCDWRRFARPALSFTCAKIMPSTRQNSSLDKPLHISTDVEKFDHVAGVSPLLHQPQDVGSDAGELRSRAGSGLTARMQTTGGSRSRVSVLVFV